MININGVEKKFGDVHALKNASFTAPVGKITGLLGPNGAGKSTCIRLISGIFKRDHGEISIDGKDPQVDPIQARKSIGILGDKRNLYTRLTSRENIEFFGRLHGLDEDFMKGRIDALISALEMKDIIDRRTDGFSTGQKVKVCLARAMIHDPKYIILDEPTSGLDVAATRALREMIKSLEVHNKSILFCSHIMQEVDEVCDRLVVINEGQTIYEGEKNQFCEDYQSKNVEEAFVRAVYTSESGVGK